jgi:hypothetical protein
MNFEPENACVPELLIAFKRQLVLAVLIPNRSANKNTDLIQSPMCFTKSTHSWRIPQFEE